MGYIGIGKTNRWANMAAEERGAFWELVYSVVSAFVVGNPISREFVFRAQFDVDFMPFSFTFADDANVGICGGLVSENVLIADREADGPNDAGKIIQLVGGKNTAPSSFR